MTRQEKRIRAYVEGTPALPATVTRVIEICNNPKSTPNDLNTVIRLDPVLTARIMRLINSSYYGIPQRVNSMVRAIILLGMNTVKNVALSAAVLVDYRGSSIFPALDDMAFWRHSLAVAVIARLLGRRADIRLGESAFLAGLMHDIGKIPMNAAYPEVYKQVVGGVQNHNLESRTVEWELFVFDHAWVGGLMCDTWNLGDDVRDPILYHHDPEAAPNVHKPVVRTVHHADIIARKLGYDTLKFRPQEAHRAKELDQLDIANEDIEQIRKSADEEIRKAEVFLNLDHPNDKDGNT